jgi:peptidoglycan biosynthesis protein MviN/MurJ (putative lipid II flippase)
VLPLRQGGLGIANTITSICNAGLLFYALRKKLGKLEMESLRATFLPLASPAFWPDWWRGKAGVFGKIPSATKTIALKIGAVFVPAGVPGWFTGWLALAFKIPAAKEMAEFALARFKRYGR